MTAHLLHNAQHFMKTTNKLLFPFLTSANCNIVYFVPTKYHFSSKAKPSFFNSFDWHYYICLFFLYVFDLAQSIRLQDGSDPNDGSSFTQRTILMKKTTNKLLFPFLTPANCNIVYFVPTKYHFSSKAKPSFFNSFDWHYYICLFFLYV